MRPPALASAVRVNSLEILALLAAALCASFVLAPACAADLIWEVENPFRFFKPTRSFALHETAFNAVRGNPSQPLQPDIIWRTERALNDPDYKAESLRSTPSPASDDDKIDSVPAPGTMAIPPAPENTEPLPQR